VIYIAPLKALARERMEDWEERFQRRLGKTVVELTGDFTPDIDALERADVVVTTPEKWDGISRHWQHRAYVRKVGLVIIDEIHLLGQDRGPVLEVIVSRMRYISCNLDKAIRFVGLSTALANAHDIADWLGIGIVGLYNFKPSVRPVPMTAHIQGYPEKHFVARMAQMNKPCFHAIKNHAVKHDGIKPTLIFVSSRRQTRLTALDIVAFMSADPDEDPKQFCKLEAHELECAVVQRDLGEDGEKIRRGSFFFETTSSRGEHCFWPRTLPVPGAAMGAFPSGEALLSEAHEEHEAHEAHGKFRQAARTFQEQNAGNSKAYVQIVCCTGLLLGILSYFIQSAALALGHLRGLLGGGEVLWVAATFNASLLVLARLVVRRNAAAQGSGYPQMKAMFFGNTKLSDHPLSKGQENVEFLSSETLALKAIGLSLVVAAQVPIGQEGPNVHMAACISRLVRPKFFERNLNCELVVQILHAACAAGVAATFSSLLGGVLLSLELMLPQIYTFQVYWGCFLGAICGAVTVILIHDGFQSSHLLSTNVLPLEGVPVHYPLACCLGYMAIGVVFGLLGGLFNLAHDQTIRSCGRLWRSSKDRWQWRDLLFVAVVGALNVVLLWKIPLLKGRSQPELLNSLFSKEFFSGHEVKSADVQMLMVALVAKVVTSLLALSLPTPTGVVAPALLLGALLMRCFTSLLPERFFAPLLGSDSPNDLDAFEARLAILGASAFSCGVVRAYGVAITIYEALSLNQMVVPLSLSSLTAVFVADYISLPFFDTALVRKGWHGVSKLTCTAHGEEPAFVVMEHASDFPILPNTARLSDLQRALDAQPLQFHFPIVEEVPNSHGRPRLLGALSRAAAEEAQRRLVQEPSAGGAGSARSVELMRLRWPDVPYEPLSELPLTVDPLFTVQELYITLKVARKEVAYITGHGVLLGRVGFKEIIGEGMPITKGIGAFHDKEAFKMIYEPNSPSKHEIWAESKLKVVAVELTLLRETDLGDLRPASSDSVEANDRLKKFDPATEGSGGSVSRTVGEVGEVRWVSAEVTDQSLKHTLEFGIGIHHAGLPERDRKVVEELFVESKIMVLISTSTLAWGVNFPAHLVIIKGTEYYDGQLKRYVDFPITDVLQMMGRAGRPQFDTEARAVVMVHEPKKNFYRSFMYEPFPVESSLHEQLTDHLNAEIVAKTIRTREEAIDYVTWTYFFRRLTANPAYYDQQAALLETPDFEKQKDMLANYIERLMNKCLDELIRSGCIELKEAPQGQSALVEPTKIGRIASLYYLSHRTVAQFQRTLAREGMSFVEIMRVLCECPEYDELPVRHNEDKLNAEFAEHCPLEVDLAIQAYDSPHTKAFLLLQAHMWGIALPINDYKTDLKTVLDRSIPLIMAMVDIAAEEAQLRSTLNLILLLQCLHQAHQPWRSSLATLPHLSDKALRILRDFGVDSLPELIERRDASKILTKLSLPSADAHKELLQIVQDMPRLRVRVELRILDPEDAEEKEAPTEAEEGKVKRRKGKLVPSPYKVPPDRELELTVVLCYDNEPMRFVHAPRFPKKKTYSWWCILGDTEVDELVSIKKALMPTRQRFEKRINFQFCSPADEVGETFTLSVLCMSDSFFGLDQQLDLSITTVEPEAA
ncbi:unnamed protein product, partial [Durusdinium trenchii]